MSRTSSPDLYSSSVTGDATGNATNDTESTLSMKRDSCRPHSRAPSVCTSSDPEPVELEAPSKPRSPMTPKDLADETLSLADGDTPTRREARELPTGSVAALRQSFMESPLDARPKSNMTDGPPRLPSISSPRASFAAPLVPDETSVSPTDLATALSTATSRRPSISSPGDIEHASESGSGSEANIKRETIVSKTPRPASPDISVESDISFEAWPKPLRPSRPGSLIPNVSQVPERPGTASSRHSSVARPETASSCHSSNVPPSNPPTSIPGSPYSTASRADYFGAISRKPVSADTSTTSITPSESASSTSSIRGRSVTRSEREVVQFDRSPSPQSMPINEEVHPAYRPKSSRASSIKEYFAEPETKPVKTKDPQDPEHRQCTSTESLCGDCQHTLRKIDPIVPTKHLTYKPNTYPVIIECILNGTTEDAAYIASSLSARIRDVVRLKVPVHAAARRSATGGHRAGRWYDVTSLEYPVTKGLTSPTDLKRRPTLLQQVFTRRSSRDESKQKQKEIAANTKLRDFRILLDLPFPLEEGGVVERHICRALPKNVKVTKIKYIRAHHTLHRLTWWARTHPAGSDRRPSQFENEGYRRSEKERSSRG